MEVNGFKLNGALPSPINKRTFISTACIPADIKVPRKLSYRDKIKYVRNQGSFGTCVGFGGTGIKNVHEFIDKDLPDGGLSPLYLYTMCKQIDGIPDIEGTYPSIAMKVLTNGILPEKDLPYSLLTNIKNLPTITDKQKQKAYPFRIKSYAQIPDNNIDALKQALVNQGPVLGALLVTPSFVNYEGGKFIGKPKGTLYGGHAIGICGYDDDLEYTFRDGSHYKGFIEIVNSWGNNWADKGFAYIPYDVINSEINNYTFFYEMWTSVDFINDTPETPKYYRVQLGAYSIKDNAYNEQQRIFNKTGWKAYVKRVDPYWKLQFGAFSIRTNAENMSKQLKDFGYNNFIAYN